VPLQVALPCASGRGAVRVTPMVTKLRLSRLGATGSVVGELSGNGTAGAIVTGSY